MALLWYFKVWNLEEGSASLDMGFEGLLLLLLFLVLGLEGLFQDRVPLCISGCPGTHSVDQAGLELRNPPVSAF